MYEIDINTIDTVAGEYTVTWYYDEGAEQPYDEGFALIVNGGRDYINIETVKPSATRFVPNDPVRVAHSVILGDKSWDRDYRSGAALVRYLTLKGYKGVTLVDENLRPAEPSTNRFETVHGVAWAPDDATYPERYTKGQLAEWEAWAEGDSFGWVLKDPSGNVVDHCWGYYGFLRSRDEILQEVRVIAEDDAAQLVEHANRVGAGLIGII